MPGSRPFSEVEVLAIQNNAFSAQAALASPSVLSDNQPPPSQPTAADAETPGSHDELAHAGTYSPEEWAEWEAFMATPAWDPPAPPDAWNPESSVTVMD